MTMTLDPYLPDAAWFAMHPPSRLHGPAHAARVLVWALALADEVDAPIQLPELLWAAALHDCRRLNDGVDVGHGERAAEWILDGLSAAKPQMERTVDLARVAALCRDHDRPSRALPSLSIELAILKDADALDRARLGNLNPHRLRLPASLALIEPARQLVRRSGPSADSVRACALEVGRWR